MGEHMELKQDIFSSFCTGQHLVDKQNHERYESTPGYVFDTLCQELGFMTLAKIDEKTSSFVYALHSPEIIWGFIRMDMPRLNPLDVLTSQSHTRHIWQVSTREDMRGWGFFRTAMGAIVEAAEEAGIFLHGISSPFLLKWPDIDTAEQFLWFIENENKFFGEQKSWKEQKNQSRRLLKKYEEFGFCKFRYPQGNGFRNRWKRNNSGFGYLPSGCNETVKETLEDYLRC